MKEKIKAEVSKAMKELAEISKFLYENPELGYQEYKGMGKLVESLENHGFHVEKGIYGMDTAFRGTYSSGKEGAKIAFLCEYDALPGIGHGCGHNLIAAMGLGAAIGLKAVIDEAGGSIVVFGTPAEETSGAKVKMAEEGAFNDVTVAMVAHPAPVTEESGGSLALNAIQLDFTGKAAHAAQAPEKGINALDAVILTFNGINALRQHVTSDVRIHGIITEGGKAPNVVPEHATAQFYVRAGKKQRRDEVTEKVIACARGAALMTGATLQVSRFETSYDDLRTNSVLSDLFTANILALGEKEVRKRQDTVGSLDMGNVSQVVPSIHPWIGLGDPNLVLHTREFADRTVTEQGREALFKGACAMAMTGYDVLASTELQEKIRLEFAQK